jgi:hypothetical protein
VSSAHGQQDPEVRVLRQVFPDSRKVLSSSFEGVVMEASPQVPEKSARHGNGLFFWVFLVVNFILGLLVVYKFFAGN